MKHLCHFIAGPVSPASSHLIETEQDEETAQQLKEANDKIASLEDQLKCRELQLHLLAVEMKEFEMKGRDSNISVHIVFF